MQQKYVRGNCYDKAVVESFFGLLNMNGLTRRIIK